VSSDFVSIWDIFSTELDARNQRLSSEIKASWKNLDGLLLKHAENITSEAWQSLPKGTLSSILDLAKTKGSIVLLEPLLSLRKARPLERALSAIENYQTDIEDVVRLLPQVITVSRSSLSDKLNWKGKPFRRLSLHMSRKPLSFSMRSVIRQVLLEHSVTRTKLDGRILLLLARATLSLLIPWQFMRDDALRALGDDQQNSHNLSAARHDWLQLCSALRVTAARVLTGYETWTQILPGHLTSALLGGDARLSERRRDRAWDRWQNCFSYWSSQQRAVVAHLELESSSARLLETSAAISSSSLASVGEEHIQLLSELDTVRGWLEAWQAGKTEGPFPPPEARLVSSEDRANEWNRRLEDAGRAALPVHVESMDPKRALPSRRTPLRSIETEAGFVKSIAAVGRAIALGGFREAEEGHRAIIREIERAREVAAYSIEAGQSDSENEEGRQAAREGIANALSLLSYQKKSATDYHPVVERRLVEALALTFFQFHLTMGENRLGLFKHLARQKGGRVVRTGAAATVARIRTEARSLRDRIGLFHQYVLTRLGWSPPSTIAVQPVVRREYLGEILNLKVGPRELPAIYKRLFRLAPIEDQRFLVGRDAEMTAVAEARRLWEEGRSVAVLVAGARGSGKTSLLNCARGAVFADVPVIIGQFCQRITTAQSMRSFLSSLLQAKVNELDRYLGSGKRIVVLEEVERTFLRRINGFQGLRALLDLISISSRNTLWILSLNETALRYLAKIIALEEHFSHRINAMAVTPDHLSNAILLRHNLSGLRLQFAAPRSADSRIGSVRRFFGLEKDAEQLYFESLYRQSEGIFRSAFELWQQSVDRVEGGVLYMLNPVDPNYGGIISRLTLQDSFTLQAILQHGGLTPEDISSIFDCTDEISKSRLEKLIALEIIEADPNSPGFRVRPEAGRIVRDVLYRQNLL
jgi:hypothetical protein